MRGVDQEVWTIVTWRACWRIALFWYHDSTVSYLAKTSHPRLWRSYTAHHVFLLERMDPERAAWLRERRDEAAAAKAEGNRLFVAQSYHEAIAAYSVPLETMVEAFVRSPFWMSTYADLSNTGSSRVGSTVIVDVFDLMGG